MRLILALCAVLAFALFAACDGNGGSSQPTSTPTADTIVPIRIPAGEPVTIGLSIALSGDQQTIGEDLAHAAALAVEDFGGALHGHPITISSRDDECTDPRKATEAAGIFTANPSLIGVVGPMCTAGAQAANPLYERSDVIHISPSATRNELSAQGEGHFFRIAWRDEVQAQVQARYAYETLGAMTASVVDDGEPYGVGLAEDFTDAYEALGGRIVAHDRVPQAGADYESIARETIEAGPAIVVYEGLNPGGALFAKALREGGFTGEFMGPDGLLSLRDFLPAAGPAGAEGAILTGGQVADTAFVERFTARAGRPPSTPFVLQAHDAVTALLRAADAAGTVDDDGSLTFDRERLTETLRRSRFAGLTGSSTFDENGDRSGETPIELGLRIYRIENSGLVLVE
jgi:branched-chain amino acid transport system substrate-binding protein